MATGRPAPCSLLPAPCSLLPAPCSLVLRQVGQRLSPAVESLMEAFLDQPLACIEQVRKSLAHQTDDRRTMRELSEHVLLAAELHVSQGAHHEASILRCLLFRRYGLVSCLLCLSLRGLKPCCYVLHQSIMLSRARARTHTDMLKSAPLAADCKPIC